MLYSKQKTFHASLSRSCQAEVVAQAQACLEAGLDGLVVAAPDLAALRGTVPPAFMTLCPGIRPETPSPCWQEASPAELEHAASTSPVRALQRGATLLLVGRPITLAPDPREAAQAVVAGLAPND